MYLYGASGHAKVVLEILESNQVQAKALFDDNGAVKQLWEYPVMVFPGEFGDNDELIIAIGSNKIRRDIAERLKCRFGKAVHTAAVVSPRSTIDAGTVVMAGAIINPAATVGKHCIINTNAVVEHDCVLGDYVHISPNAVLCGNVTIEEGVHVGAGAVVIPGIKIGKWAVIGAGSVVIKNVEEGVTIVGNPGDSKREIIKLKKEKS